MARESARSPPSRVRPRTRRSETGCRARPNRLRAGLPPWSTVSLDAATARIAASTGPMQGVQPNAKAKAHRVGAPDADGLRHRRPLFPHQQAQSASSPRKCSPITMMAIAGEDCELRREPQHQRTDGAGARAERDEHGRKAGYERAPPPRWCRATRLVSAPRRRAARARCRPDKRDRAAPAAARRATESLTAPR